MWQYLYPQKYVFQTWVLSISDFRKDWLESWYKGFSIYCTNIYMVFQFLCNFQIYGWIISYILQVLETNNNIVVHEYYSFLLTEQIQMLLLLLL